MNDRLDVSEPAPVPMTIARCRELLGADANGLSDDEIDALRQHADAMANILIDIFLTNRAPET